MKLDTYLKRGWHVEYDPKPIPTDKHDYTFYHEDWEHAWTAGSIDEVIERIEEYEDEQSNDN